MIYLILALLVIAIIVGPQLWIRRVMSQYNVAREDIPGSGGQFARHLINKLTLADSVSVEACEGGDHYDPQAKAVRLGSAHFDQRSIAAITIAAHEVGHAIQHAENNRWLALRQQLLKAALVIEKIAPVTLTIAPLLLAVTRSPLLSFVVLAIGFLSIAMTTLLHLITLPVELDASFNKALPLLLEGNYLPQPDDYPKARQLLRAAALTYVAQSLFNLLNIAYWLRIFRR